MRPQTLLTCLTLSVALCFAETFVFLLGSSLRPEAWCEKVIRENLYIPGIESWLCLDEAFFVTHFSESIPNCYLVFPRMLLSNVEPICRWHFGKSPNAVNSVCSTCSEVPLAERLEQELELPIIAINDPWQGIGASYVMRKETRHCRITMTMSKGEYVEVFGKETGFICFMITCSLSLKVACLWFAMREAGLPI